VFRVHKTKRLRLRRSLPLRRRQSSRIEMDREKGTHVIITRHTCRQSAGDPRASPGEAGGDTGWGYDRFGALRGFTRHRIFWRSNAMKIACVPFSSPRSSIAILVVWTGHHMAVIRSQASSRGSGRGTLHPPAAMRMPRPMAEEVNNGAAVLYFIVGKQLIEKVSDTFLFSPFLLLHEKKQCEVVPCLPTRA
jgi:hypothetical protein